MGNNINFIVYSIWVTKKHNKVKKNRRFFVIPALAYECLMSVQGTLTKKLNKLQTTRQMKRIIQSINLNDGTSINRNRKHAKMENKKVTILKGKWG